MIKLGVLTSISGVYTMAGVLIHGWTFIGI
jgi:hypothetical protein